MPQQGLMPPPPGVTPNFDNPQVKNHAVYPIGAIGIVTSASFLALRLYTKIKINKLFGSEDVCLILAWFMLVATTILITISQTYWGSGRHGWDITVAQWKMNQKALVADTVLYVPGLALAKISMLLIFHRISPSGNYKYRWVINGFIGFVAAFAVAMTFVQIFPCQPIAAAWDPTIIGHCINRPAVYLSIAAVGIFTDLGLLVLPIPIALDFQGPKQQKIVLFLMFAVGSLVVVTSIMRTVTIVSLLNSKDPTWDIIDPSLWVILEAHLLVVCPCFMSLRSFFRRHAPWILGEKPHDRGMLPKESNFKSDMSNSSNTNQRIVQNVTVDVNDGDDRAGIGQDTSSCKSEDFIYPGRLDVRKGSDTSDLHRTFSDAV